MRHSEQQLGNISNKIKEYISQPSAFRVFILYGAPLSHKTTIAKKLCEELDGKYVDFLGDDLAKLQPMISLYGPKNLKEDIDRWSKETNSLLVVDELEPLLDTWTREQQKSLFKLLARWRTNSVILIVTKLHLPYEDLLGKERIFRVG